MAIKIGDEVIPNCAVGGLIPGKRYKVTGRNGLLIKIEGSTLDYHHSYFNVTSSDIPSPIRTRREIVPGVYGPIEVGGMNENRRIYLRVVGDAYKADDIREIIHIASQVLEVLEENAG